MRLDQYLDQLETKKDILKASSYFDYPWRQRSGAVFLKLVPKALEGIPVEAHQNCVVAKDALHFLNIYRQFREPATVKEFLDVVNTMKEGKWADDQYVPFHLRMYGTSFCHLKLMEGKSPESEVESAKNSQVVFVPVFSVNDAEERFVVIRENLAKYEVSDVRIRPMSEKYLAMNVHEGFQASRGESAAEPENMAW